MKKLMTSTIILLPLLILAIMLVSGAIASLSTHINVESVEFVEKESLVLTMDDMLSPPKEQLKVNILPLEAKNRDLVFKADDDSIVDVDENGIVTAKFYGETYITVTSKENSAAMASRKVIVTDDTVHAIRFKPFLTEMYKGETQQLFAETFPVGAADNSLKWSSSDESVLIVSNSGDVVCKGSGIAKITVTSANDPSVFETAEIVCHTPLSSISTNVSTVFTGLTSATFPDITVVPADATYKLVYTSSNEDIAKVDEKGAITFVGPGAVTITATASDDRGHSSSAAVKYDCTYGYFANKLFEKPEYVFDYDEYAGKDLPIKLQTVPKEYYRKITDVTFSTNNMILFNAATETFSLAKISDSQPLGVVKVTLSAQKYDVETGVVREFSTDICDINIRRKTQTLSFEVGGQKVSGTTIFKKSINFAEIVSGANAGGIGVSAYPQNHTDTIAFSLQKTDIARMSGSTLIFDEKGSVTVTATAKDDSGQVSATEDITVTYSEPTDSEKSVEVSIGSAELQRLDLVIHANGTKEYGLLSVTTPEGMKVRYSVDDSDIVDIENGRIVPLKGGIATVTVAFEGNGKSIERKISVYSNCEVLSTDIAFDIDNDFVTAGERISYTVTLSVSADAMIGKRLLLDGVPVESVSTVARTQDGTSKLIYKGVKKITFGEERAMITASVEYSQVTSYGLTGEICSATVSVKSTHGKLLAAPRVTYGNGCELGPDVNHITFDDLGEEIVFGIDATTPVPEDFRLDETMIDVIDIDISEMNLFTWRIKSIGSNKAVVSFVSKTSGSGEVTLRIAGQTFVLKLDISAPANTISVRYGDRVLEDGQEYTTLLSSLEIAVTIGRSDGRPVTDPTVWYRLGDGEEQNATAISNACDISITASGTIELSLRCGNADIAFSVKKQTLDDLELLYHPEYSDNGELRSLEPFTIGEETEISYIFPKTLQGEFDLRIELPSMPNNLGGLSEEDTSAYFSMTTPAEWTYSVSAAFAKISVKLPADTDFIDEELVFTAGKASIKLVLTRICVARIEFTGFDIGDKVNGGDVYKGYQQVRVFAKKSHIDGVEVDYISVPVKAIRNEAQDSRTKLSDLIWTFTKYTDDAADGVITVQRGHKIFYDNKTYEISDLDGECVLKSEDGNIIVQNGKYVEGAPRITFADTLSDADSGYVRIYFGDFKGLTETDVINDYFGNFGEKANWSKTPENADDYDGSGRTFAASDNAYSFLQVAAGDGAKDSKVNCHYNFNVIEGNDIYNVFDADGYYAHTKLVLHANLYGKGEGQSDDGYINDKLVLDKEANIADKTIIFGNGYQINLNARNDVLPLNNKGENTGTSTSFGTFVNLTVKGRNPIDVVHKSEVKMYFLISGAYYSDIQYYSKLDPKDKNLYIKNTILRRVAVNAVQLYYGNNAYFENIVVTDAMKGISIEANYGSAVYFKGFVDFLNYNSLQTFASAFNEFSSLMMMFKSDVYPWLEWHGKENQAVTQKNDAKWFIDPIIIATQGGASAPVYSWNGAEYVQNGTLEDGTQIIKVLDVMGIAVGYTYSTEVSVDGGLQTKPGKRNPYDDRNMDLLFTDDRYIRLLCEYKTLDESGTPVKNDEHILWHMQKIYRDVDLIEGREKHHLADLKKSLGGVTWPDGTSADELINTVASNTNELLSQAILPSRREYE